ncbi:uncharacterized protein LOC123679355 [Harmonia axyridis]|uniref:uncharacterized protein LOC123679355 n=1 Tax=Harmonia axyridis TaxID=115357 RepID=UPI001E277194|nr:uncharacterized protein LOC123679355 [Harmonia axyridis]
MSQQSETNQTHLPRRTPVSLNSIKEHVRHLAEELEIDGADGLQGNEMEIIALIRNCPLLYDKSFPDYNDSKKKDQAWKAIGEVFNVTSRDLQQFWEALKQSFVEFSGRRVKGNATNYPTYFDEMQFLNAVNTSMRSRKPSCSSTIQRRDDSGSTASSEPDDTNTCNELNVDALIEKIRINPILYDRKHRDAKNHDLKLKTWKKLAKEIGIPVSDCVNRWKILREKYAKERKYRKSNPDGRKWYLFEKLSFLEAHVFKKRYSHTHMPARVPRGFLNNDAANPLRDDMYSSSKSVVNDNQAQGLVLESRGPKSNAEYDMILDQMSTRQFFEDNNGTIDDIFVSSVIEESLKDEDELFALTIAAELKRITNSRKKIKLKADIYKLLQANLQQ